MSVSLSKTKGRPLGDLLKAFWHAGYCLASTKLVNPIASAITLTNPLGQPLKVSGSNYVFVQDGDESNTTAILLHDKPIVLSSAGTTDELYPILVRGPALIDKDALPATDVNGDALTASTIVTALAGLSPKIIGLSEPSKTSTQTD